MATQKSVITLLKKQGAEFEWETPDTFSAWLPDGKDWEGYGGIVTQEKDPNETWGQFWNELMTVIQSDVVDA